jgi:hypothetical protein
LLQIPTCKFDRSLVDSARLTDRNIEAMDHYDAIISDAEGKLEKQELAVIETKKFINQVLEFAGRTPRYEIGDLVTSSSGGTRAPREITRNEFYGKQLATCVRDYLGRREAAGMVREATLDEIIGALEQGNYDLKKHGGSRDAQRRGVAITLAKNTKTFHKLPNGDFGLEDWYNKSALRKERRPGKSNGDQIESVDDLVEIDPISGDEDLDALREEINENNRIDEPDHDADETDDDIF